MSAKALEKIEVKTIKHVFTQDEREQMNSDLLGALDNRDTTEADFENVKQTWKAKVTEADARIGTLRASIRAGFDMRQTRCRVVFRPKDRKKDYYLADDSVNGDSEVVMLTEDMTDADMQAELLAAESVFDKREEIVLFPPTDRDSGILVVGKLQNRWYAALRIRVGNVSLDERLDSEQRNYKNRFDAIKTHGKKALEWLKEHFKKDADGFEQPLMHAIEQHRERAE